MPITTDEVPRRQSDRDRQPSGSLQDEPRNSDLIAPGVRTDSDQRADAAPYYPEDEDINFGGSER